ncbi:MAG: hypothetical protein AAF488_02240 [Planctomycetota bacterium]
MPHLTPRCRSRGSVPWTILAVAAVLVLVVFTIGAISLKLALDAGLPAQPLELPFIAEVTPDLHARWESAKSTAGGARFTPEELSGLVQTEFDRWAEAGEIGSPSEFRLELNGPGKTRVRVRASVRLADSAGQFLAGRYVNLDVTAHVVRTGGEFETLEIESYQYGSLDPVVPDDSAALLERLKADGRIPAEAWRALEHIEEFRVDGDQIVLKRS